MVGCSVHKLLRTWFGLLIKYWVGDYRRTAACYLPFIIISIITSMFDHSCVIPLCIWKVVVLQTILTYLLRLASTKMSNNRTVSICQECSYT